MHGTVEYFLSALVCFAIGFLMAEQIISEARIISHVHFGIDAIVASCFITVGIHLVNKGLRK